MTAAADRENARRPRRATERPAPRAAPPVRAGRRQPPPRPDSSGGYEAALRIVAAIISAYPDHAAAWAPTLERLEAGVAAGRRDDVAARARAIAW